MEHAPPRRRPARAVVDAPIDRLLPRTELLAKGWLLALLEDAPLGDAPAILATDLARDGPRICDAVVRALADDTDLRRLSPGGALELLISQTAEFAGADRPDAISRAVDTLHAVIWSAVRDELHSPDPDLIAALAERLSLVIERVRAAALRRSAQRAQGQAEMRAAPPREREVPSSSPSTSEPGSPPPAGPGRPVPPPLRVARDDEGSDALRAPFAEPRQGAASGEAAADAGLTAAGEAAATAAGAPPDAARATPDAARTAPDAARTTPDAARAPLTEASREALWVGALEDEIGRSQRTGAPLSLLLVELEEAERVLSAAAATESTGTFGRFAQAVRSVVRRQDILACETESRAWVIARDTGRGGAHALGSRIAAAVRVAEPWRGAPLTVSAGVAVLGEDGGDADALIDAAEEAKFAAAASGIAIVRTGSPEDGGDEPPVDAGA